MPLSYGGTPPPTNVPNQVLDQNNNIISQGVNIAKVQLTAAQLLALFVTPIVIIPPPGPGLAIDLDSITLKYFFNGVAYTLNAGTLKLFLGLPATGLALTADLSALLTQAATSGNTNIPTLSTGVTAIANIENQGVYLGNTGGAAFTLGNGVLDVIVEYNVIQT